MFAFLTYVLAFNIPPLLAAVVYFCLQNARLKRDIAKANAALGFLRPASMRPASPVPDWPASPAPELFRTLARNLRKQKAEVSERLDEVYEVMAKRGELIDFVIDEELPETRDASAPSLEPEG